MSFGVHHYAGKVMCNAEGFVASNQDTLPTDLIEIGEKSSNLIVKEKIEEEVPAESGKRGGPSIRSWGKVVRKQESTGNYYSSLGVLFPDIPGKKKKIQKVTRAVGTTIGATIRVFLLIGLLDADTSHIKK